MITISFYSPFKNARRIQILVMKYDGRFVANPYEVYGTTNGFFKITFEDGMNYRKFSACHQLLEQPFV